MKNVHNVTRYEIPEDTSEPKIPIMTPHTIVKKLKPNLPSDDEDDNEDYSDSGILEKKLKNNEDKSLSD